MRTSTEVGDGVPWRDFLAEATQRLQHAEIPDPVISARRIVEEASGIQPTELSLRLDEPATTRAVAYFDAMMARRLAGEPLQYVLGRWSFRSLDLFLDRRVLIPRPETEEVAGWAIEEAERMHAARGRVSAVDLGTGSGAIGLALVTEVDDVDVWLTDNSSAALDVARANLAGVGRDASRVRIAEGDWFAALPDALRRNLDLVVSNPPYVAVGDRLDAQVLEWEPTEALFAGAEGLDDLTRLIAEVGEWLVDDGALVVEIGAAQGPAVAELAQHRFHDVLLKRDLSGRDRAIVARRPRGVA